MSRYNPQFVEAFYVFRGNDLGMLTSETCIFIWKLL